MRRLLDQLSGDVRFHRRNAIYGMPRAAHSRIECCIPLFVFVTESDNYKIGPINVVTCSDRVDSPIAGLAKAWFDRT